MLFKDLKPGNELYILDKEKVEVQKGTVNNITPPHVSTQPGVLGMFVDVSVNVGGTPKLYVLNENGVTAYAENNNNTVITTDVNNILNEIKGIKIQTENILKNIDKYKENVQKCDSLLAELDPVFKKEQANELRFSKLEEAVANQSKTNSEIKEMLTKLLTK